MTLEITKDVLLAGAAILWAGKTGWEFWKAKRNGHNGKVSYKDMMDCQGAIHEKFNGYHNDVMQLVFKQGERLTAVETVVEMLAQSHIHQKD